MIGDRVDLSSSSWGLCLCPSQDRTMHRLVPSDPCPELNCAESEQIVLSDRCCKVCRGMEEALFYTGFVITHHSILNYRTWLFNFLYFPLFLVGKKVSGTLSRSKQANNLQYFVPIISRKGPKLFSCNSWYIDINFPPLHSSPLDLNFFTSVPSAGHDFCSEGHSCMEHSDCVNLEAGDCCVCKDGFRPLRDDNAYCEGTAWLSTANPDL